MFPRRIAWRAALNALTASVTCFFGAKVAVVFSCLQHVGQILLPFHLVVDSGLDWLYHDSDKRKFTCNGYMWQLQMNP